MKSDRISGIIIFVIGLAVCLASLSYPIGTLQKPGGGFFPLLASILLLGLSIVFIFQSFTAKRGAAGVVSFFPGNEAFKRIFCGLAALLGYRYLIPVIGFAPATAAFIFFLGKFMERYSWKKSIFFSVATAVSAYYLFQVVLKIAMPIPLLR